MSLEELSTINALYRKANALANESRMLSAAGPHSGDPALYYQSMMAASQEAYYCSQKAHALQAGGQFNYPGSLLITQVNDCCQALEQAMAASVAWAAIIAAGDGLIKTMPGNSV